MVSMIKLQYNKIKRVYTGEFQHEIMEIIINKEILCYIIHVHCLVSLRLKNVCKVLNLAVYIKFAKTLNACLMSCSSMLSQNVLLRII